MPHSPEASKADNEIVPDLAAAEAESFSRARRKAAMVRLLRPVHRAQQRSSAALSRRVNEAARQGWGFGPAKRPSPLSDPRGWVSAAAAVSPFEEDELELGLEVELERPSLARAETYPTTPGMPGMPRAPAMLVSPPVRTRPPRARPYHPVKRATKSPAKDTTAAPAQHETRSRNAQDVQSLVQTLPKAFLHQIGVLNRQLKGGLITEHEFAIAKTIAIRRCWQQTSPTPSLHGKARAFFDSKNVDVGNRGPAVPVAPSSSTLNPNDKGLGIAGKSKADSLKTRPVKAPRPPKAPAVECSSPKVTGKRFVVSDKDKQKENNFGTPKKSWPNKRDANSFLASKDSLDRLDMSLMCTAPMFETPHLRD
uniref:Uncharacterized protein n=1 Tax=Phaeomonas parva TaxID=124430 RepID=A0A7S1XT58_9STRA|mmetsp:Transcript_30993/g.98422  ORF Transcript_30993/g.98422 Transcript_30993/m.98422 type:complete len:366 (+) Transcript_30993:229-1326(+)